VPFHRVLTRKWFDSHDRCPAFCAGVLAVASSAAERSLFGEIKVLVAADEYRVRKVIHGLLLASGCTKIHEAPNGGEALERIASLAPDVVLLDWMLPDMNGPEFL